MKTKPELPLKCSICGDMIGMEISGWRGGHNAEPVAKGRCCSVCNDTVVQVRIALMYKAPAARS